MNDVFDVFAMSQNYKNNQLTAMQKQSEQEEKHRLADEKLAIFDEIRNRKIAERDSAADKDPLIINATNTRNGTEVTGMIDGEAGKVGNPQPDTRHMQSLFQTQLLASK